MSVSREYCVVFELKNCRDEFREVNARLYASFVDYLFGRGFNVNLYGNPDAVKCLYLGSLKAESEAGVEALELELIQGFAAWKAEHSPDNLLSYAIIRGHVVGLSASYG